MNKILIFISILIWSILTAMNINWQWDLIFTYWNGSQLAIFAIFIWVVLWFWLKWFLIEKSWNSYDDDNNGWVNF